MPRPAQDALQPLRPMGSQGHLGRHLPGPGLGWRNTGGGAHRFLGGECARLRLRRQGGEQNQAIGRSRGGRTTKIHVLTDGLCRPIAFLLTGFQVADCTAGDLLLEQMPKSPIVHADKGYDSNAMVEGKRQCRTSHPRPTGAGEIATRRSFTAMATPSSAVRTPQGFPPNRHTIRSIGDELPCRRLPRGHR